jgi:hypothetical protein
MIMRADVVMWHHNHLITIKIYRNKGMNVVYNDKLWVKMGTNDRNV